MPSGSRDGPRRAAGLRARVRQAGDPVVDGPHPVRVDAELGHHLVGHEPRRGVHPGPLGHGPADQGREAERGRRRTARGSARRSGRGRSPPGPPGGSGARRSWCRARRRGARRTIRPGARGSRRHAACSGGPAWPAGGWTTPAGTRAGDALAPPPAHGEGGHVDASGVAARPARAPAQNTPTPVGRPSSGVASRPTDSRPGSAVADRSGGTQRSLAHRRSTARSRAPERPVIGPAAG